jgi:NAD(P)H dehydrogenase (quinone)
MRHIRLIGGFSTYGSPWWWLRFAVGDLGRRTIMRGLRPLCHRRCRTFWLGHYRMDSSTPASREAFLAKVEGLAARL